jgi:proliferating cell nuclear antigen
MSESSSTTPDQSTDQTEKEPDVSTEENEGDSAPEDATSSEQSSEPFTAAIEAENLQAALDSVGVLVDECKVHLTSNGWEIRAVDPANVGMVDLDLATGAFESYQGANGIIGVRLERFRDVVGMADAGQLIHLELMRETRDLKITYDGLEYTLALLDPEGIRKEPDAGKLNQEFPATVELKGAQLIRAKTAAKMVADHIQFSVSEAQEEFVVTAEGDTDTVDFNLTEDDLESLQPANVSSVFSIEYIKKVVRPIDKTTEVVLEIGNEYPISISFALSEDGAEVSYLIAPRIQQD